MTTEIRESLGRIVRKMWVEWAREQPAPKVGWLWPWEDLSEPEKEVHRRIGAALFLAGEQCGIALQACGVVRVPAAVAMRAALRRG
jgi:hypothetical protein